MGNCSSGNFGDVNVSSPVHPFRGLSLSSRRSSDIRPSSSSKPKLIKAGTSSNESASPSHTRATRRQPKRTHDLSWIPAENHVESIHNVLDIQEQFATGSTCKVFRAAWKIDDEEEVKSTISEGHEAEQLLAVKKMPHPRQTKFARREVEILNTLSHPNIARFEAVYTDQKDVWVATELYTGESLIRVLKKSDRHGFAEGFAKNICRQLLSAIGYLHSNGIVHRDIKPDNIVFADPSRTRIVLVDFGSSRFLHDIAPISLDWAGTPAFMSPEMFCERTHEDLKKVDMWAAGVTCYVTLTGYFPFFGRDISSIRKEIETKKLVFPRGMHISQEYRDFVLKLLNRNKLERMTATVAMYHPWIHS